MRLCLETTPAVCLHRYFDWEMLSQCVYRYPLETARILSHSLTARHSMQGQETSIKEDIDDQYRLLRRDVQHGRAGLVRQVRGIMSGVNPC